MYSLYSDLKDLTNVIHIMQKMKVIYLFSCTNLMLKSLLKLTFQPRIIIPHHIYTRTALQRIFAKIIYGINMKTTYVTSSLNLMLEFHIKTIKLLRHFDHWLLYHASKDIYKT